MKSKIQATVIKNSGYDALQPIYDFNNLSGNEFKSREMYEQLPSLYMNLIDEEYLELQEAHDTEDFQGYLDSLADLIVVAAGGLYSVGIHPNEVLRVVNESNMSKFCTTEQEAKDSVAAYKDDHRYEDVHYEYNKENNKYVIRGKKIGQDGWKILKSVNWQEPDFSHLIGKGE